MIRRRLARLLARLRRPRCLRCRSRLVRGHPTGLCVVCLLDDAPAVQALPPAFRCTSCGHEAVAEWYGGQCYTCYHAAALQILDPDRPVGVEAPRREMINAWDADRLP
jgi:hypothetical protein